MIGLWQAESSKCVLFVALVIHLVRGPVHHLDHMDLTRDVIVVGVAREESRPRKRGHLKQMDPCFSRLGQT